MSPFQAILDLRRAAERYGIAARVMDLAQDTKELDAAREAWQESDARLMAAALEYARTKGPKDAPS